jgi:tetratricopeptide (TPR) repeat protein
MARAAVKAKQQARAKAQPAKAARGRGRRGHSGGGNPNQQLFFMRLRRGQKWLYALLAVIFAVTFAGVGVGSGTNGLSQLYSGMFGGGGGAVSKAKDEIKKNPAKGYRDLATAYETKGDSTQAITALQSYLAVKKKDANVWAELGGLELTQGQTYATQYQQAQQAAQLADPSQAFLPGGTLATAVGANAAYQGAAQRATSQTTQLYQQATGAYSAGLKDYQQAAKIQPHNAQAQLQVATAAQTAGQPAVELKALKRYLQLDPNAPQRAQIESAIKQLSKGQPTINSSGSQQPKYGKK